MKVFYENYKKVSSVAPGQTYETKMNEFADLTKEEFIQQKLGIKSFDLETMEQEKEMSIQSQVEKCAKGKEGKACRKERRKRRREERQKRKEEKCKPDEDKDEEEKEDEKEEQEDEKDQDEGSQNGFDWRDHNAVTPVENQGACGSCWAFSATGALEGLKAIRGEGLVKLSEQQMMDCSTSNHSCNGGWMASAFDYVRDHGISSSQSYPYLARDQSCQTSLISSEFEISGNAYVLSDVDALKLAVERQPITVAVDASDWEFYSSGIYNNPNCLSGINHGVLLVGYDKDENNNEYWIVKNSWGESWGENGYIRMAINYEAGSNGNNGMCGILMYANYPTI